MRGEDRARARGPAWAPAPTWGPEDGAEQREVFELVRRELEDANARGVGRRFDAGAVRRLPFEHVRRCANLLEAALADPTYVAHDAAGFLWSALTSPSWKWDGRLAECTDYNREAFRAFLAKRTSSSGETRPVVQRDTKPAIAPAPRVDQVVTAPRPVSPPVAPPVRPAAEKLRAGEESFALERALVAARKQIREQLEAKDPSARAELERFAQELVRERCSKTASAIRRENELARARNEVLETFVDGGAKTIEALARELVEAGTVRA